MRVLIDSNVLVSAIYAPNSTPHQAYKKAVETPYQGLICTFSLLVTVGVRPSSVTQQPHHAAGKT